MLYSLGILLLVGSVFGHLSNRVNLPAVTGYVVAGVLIGPSLLNLIPAEVLHNMSLIETLALSLIALAIGGELKYRSLRSLGNSIILVTLAQGLGAFILVFLAASLVGAGTPVALLLAALSTATAPAATLAVIKEYKAKGVLTNSLLAVVALDDALCIMIFSFTAAFTMALSKGIGLNLHSLITPLEEIAFSLALGIGLGLITAIAVRRLKDLETLAVTLGMAFLAGGIAEHLALSVLLTNMALGAAIANLSSREDSIFNLIENVEPPVYVAFFAFAGTQLQLSSLAQVGVLGLAYIAARVIGKVGGAYLGAAITKAPTVVRKYLGLGLIPQAGVAIGLSLIAGQKFPELRPTILTVILASVVVFELIGPLAAKLAIVKAGEAHEDVVRPTFHPATAIEKHENA